MIAKSILPINISYDVMTQYVDVTRITLYVNVYMTEMVITIYLCLFRHAKFYVIFISKDLILTVNMESGQ